MGLLSALIDEVKAGRVRAFRHPHLPLTGFNYTETCQFDKQWNNINIQCRGLVIDDTGTIVARPFTKFFNYEELGEAQKLFSPEDIASINNKEDGSLIIAFWYAGAWRFCTRGSFVSDQAFAAVDLWEANPAFHANADKNATHLFELVGPDNVNVLRSYKENELILLGIINTSTGTELSKSELIEMARLFRCNFARSYEWNNDLLEMIKNNNNPNFEGIVVTLKNGLRFKLKSTLYCQFHRVITGDWTPRRTMEVWMSRYEGKMDLDPTIPDEFYVDLKARLAEVDGRYNFWTYEQKSLIQKAGTQIIVCRTMNNDKDSDIRKLLAITMPEVRPYLNILFSAGIYSEWEAFEPVSYKLFCNKELA